MERLTRAEAQKRWKAQMRTHGWLGKTIDLIMFGAKPNGKPARYKPGARAWQTIADLNDTADIQQYFELEKSLIRQAEVEGCRGSSARQSIYQPPLALTPKPINRMVAVATIKDVMQRVHPQVIAQEQILRAAFFGALPQEYRETIGTVESAVHPERPTPGEYSFSGNVEMHARYDISFGHPTESTQIAGAMELKAWLGTFGFLENVIGKIMAGTAAAEVAVGVEEHGEPIGLDILKLLDPELPEDAFRISWVALGKPGGRTALEVRRRAEQLVQWVANDSKRCLPSATCTVDPATGWLVFSWPESRRRLELAWYSPTLTDPSKFVPVFNTDEESV